MVSEKVAALINTHIQRYAEIDILDIYKLLHQANFGPGHALQGAKAQKGAREWLDRESELLTPSTTDPVIENIHPNGEVVRVHLRPYLAARGKLNKLLEGFIESSNVIIGDPHMMAVWWAMFQEMVDGPLGNRFDRRAVFLEGQVRVSEHWAASHHSPRFERAYKPAYRVLTASLATKILQQQNIPFTIV